MPSVNLWIQLTVMESSSIGFPHSEICGSMLACSSPQLIAAGHVLHRRMVPWHPPCALSSLIFSSLRPETNCSLLSSYALIHFHELRSFSVFATGLPLNHSLCSCQGAYPNPENDTGSRRTLFQTSDPMTRCASAGLPSFFIPESGPAFFMLR